MNYLTEKKTLSANAHMTGKIVLGRSPTSNWNVTLDNIRNTLYSLYTTMYTLPTVQYTLPSIQWTIHSLYNVQYTHYTINSILTIQYTHYTFTIYSLYAIQHTTPTIHSKYINYKQHIYYKPLRIVKLHKHAQTVAYLLWWVAISVTRLGDFLKFVKTNSLVKLAQMHISF